MGELLKKIFDLVLKKYGEVGLYRFVVRIQVLPEDVIAIEDSEELMFKVEKAIQELGFEL